MQAEQRDDRAERPRHRRAERDQHVHVRAAATQRVPRADVEAAADPELDRRGERQLPASAAEVRVDVRESRSCKSIGNICASSGSGEDRGDRSTSRRSSRYAGALACLVGLALDSRVDA